MGDFFPPDSAPSDREGDFCLDGDAVRNLWLKWPAHCLVLFSFFLQVVLFVCAGFRRRSANATLRSVLWLAYLLADSVATYTLGHLFVKTNCGEQRLQAFWAPFLLLHLGGQDTITAYALEDNRLWLRHLQALGVQVLAAASVLIGYFDAGGWALVTAGVLMFSVGSLKYGERIWALKSANNDGMYRFLISYCKQETTQVQPEGHEAHLIEGRSILEELHTEEKVMHGAHTLLGISLGMFLDCEEEACRHNNGALSVLACLVTTSGDHEIYRVIEMQLSLIYDMMYTKARVIHTWYGLCIRVLSLLAIVATVILMFRFVNTENTVDVYITYVLLVGALVMEIASGFIAVVSTWTRHGWIWNLAIYLRRLVKAKWWRRWSGSGLIGQFNMIESCAEVSFSDSDGISSVLPLFQGTVSLVQVTEPMEISIRRQVLDVVVGCHGEAESMYTLNRTMGHLNDNLDFGTKVIIWHLATHLILNNDVVKEQVRQLQLQQRVAETNMLSNYMMFLLKEHPDMLPGHTRRNLYTEAMQYLQRLGGAQGISNRLLANSGTAREQDENITCLKGGELANEMVAKIPMMQNNEEAGLLDEIFGVWVEMLCYAGSHCSRDSHARSLSRGGEFMTVVWLLAGHFADYERYKSANNGGP